MPTATSSTWPRNHTQSNATPARQTRAQSPPLSAYSFSQTATVASSKANIVTRSVIEGKVKKDRDGASVKMYLKLAVPLDTLTSTTIPLFAEENVRVLDSQVHPLDSNSAPYNFLPSTSPLLHKASRALNLPARLNKDYQSQFDDSGASGIPVYNRAASSSKSVRRIANQEPGSLLDAKYTGQITVSEYHVVFLLPKEFPLQHRVEDGDEEGSYLSRMNPSTSSGKRRVSISERSALQFMVAIDLWIPYTSKPPRAPFLLSIPTPPRCLHNNIRLHIFSPTPQSVSNSFASLSSVEEDSGSAWDIASEPNVSRTSSRLSRGASYNDFADDESSDSSIVADGSGIQGTFPSTDRLCIRWARPTRVLFEPHADARRRVGVERSSGETTCSVLGRPNDGDGHPSGVVMRVEYHGRVTGVWYSGVATLLGLDINLESKNSDVVWAPHSTSWEVSGGVGYTGWSSASSPAPLSRQQSRDSFSAPNTVVSSSNGHPSNVRQDSSSSTSSLLRAPLPNQMVPEYSFEGSNTPDSSGTLSPPSSVPASALYETVKSSQEVESLRPGAPLTIHLNINELTPSSKGISNTLTFNISGIVVVTPRHNASSSRHASAPHADDNGDNPIVLPKFTVLAADKETTTWIVKNEVETSNTSAINVEVYSLSGDIRDAQSKKTVLWSGSLTRCGEEGARIILRTLRTTRQRMDTRPALQDTSVERTPRAMSSMILKPNHKAPETPLIVREGPLMIPWIIMKVIPLITFPSLGNPSSEHIVQLSMPTIPQENEEWLVFGVCHPVAPKTLEASSVDIACASVDGVPVRYERSLPKSKKKHQDQLDQHREMITDLRVKLGTTKPGANLLLEYIVSETREMSAEDGNTAWEVVLPSLPLPVGRLEVVIERPVHFSIDVTSNLQQEASHDSSHILRHWSLDKGFQPVIQVSLRTIKPAQKPISSPPWRRIVGAITKLAMVGSWLVLLFSLSSMNAELGLMKQALVQIGRQAVTPPSWSPPPPPETWTVTTTIFTSMTKRERSPQETKIISSPSISTVEAFISTPTMSTSIVDIRQSAATTVSTTAPFPESTEAEKGLSPLYQLPLAWNLHLDIPLVSQATVEKMLQGWKRACQVMSRIYHYPLPPPS